VSRHIRLSPPNKPSDQLEPKQRNLENTQNNNIKNNNSSIELETKQNTSVGDHSRSDWLRVGAYSSRGARRTNEDRFVTIPELPDDPSTGFFAVYDGHGGQKASSYCAEHLHNFISKEECYATDLKQAIINGFIKTDKHYIKSIEEGGSVAAVAFVLHSKRKLIVANAGDCRVIISLDKKAVALSEDHRPSSQKERERIEKAKHTVETSMPQGKEISRVDGILAVSRAIGDSDFKSPPSAPPEEQAVTCVPDIFDVSLSRSHRFMIIACDGLWDVLENQEVVDFVEERLPQNLGSCTSEILNGICSELVDVAIQRKSVDNVTLLLVVFDQH